jgi:hypothetical protein
VSDFSASGLSSDFREVIDLAQNSIGFVNDSLARFGKANLPLIPVKEFNTEFLLQLAYLLTQGGLADVETDCGAAEMKFFSHGDEVTQMPEVHYSSETVSWER